MIRFACSERRAYLHAALSAHFHAQSNSTIAIVFKTCHPIRRPLLLALPTVTQHQIMEYLDRRAFMMLRRTNKILRTASFTNRALDFIVSEKGHLSDISRATTTFLERSKRDITCAAVLAKYPRLTRLEITLECLRDFEGELTGTSYAGEMSWLTSSHQYPRFPKVTHIKVHAQKWTDHRTDTIVKCFPTTVHVSMVCDMLALHYKSPMLAHPNLRELTITLDYTSLDTLVRHTLPTIPTLSVLRLRMFGLVGVDAESPVTKLAWISVPTVHVQMDVAPIQRSGDPLRWLDNDIAQPNIKTSRMIAGEYEIEFDGPINYKNVTSVSVETSITPFIPDVILSKATKLVNAKVPLFNAIPITTIATLTRLTLTAETKVNNLWQALSPCILLHTLEIHYRFDVGTVSLSPWNNAMSTIQSVVLAPWRHAKPFSTQRCALEKLKILTVHMEMGGYTRAARHWTPALDRVSWTELLFADQLTRFTLSVVGSLGESVLTRDYAWHDDCMNMLALYSTTL